MVKLRLKVGPKGQIVIPKILREKYGIRENGYVLVDVRNDELSVARAHAQFAEGLWHTFRRRQFLAYSLKYKAIVLREAIKGLF
jgi:AbrB family looped-hinge helix DNA binding protein